MSFRLSSTCIPCAIVALMAAFVSANRVSAEAISPADLVATDGRIYTVNRARSTAESLAVREGKIVFVGSRIDAQRFMGPDKTCAGQKQ